MHFISAALASLNTLLSAPFPRAPGLQFFDVSLRLNDGFDPLAWVAHQRCFPQFYWQQRDGDEEVATLGAAKYFPALGLAQDFLRQHTGQDDMRIWGLNAFTPEQGLLFLPRLEWRRCGSVATLRLWLYSEVSLQEDAQKAAAFLTTLVAAKPLPALRLQALRTQHLPSQSGWNQLIERATGCIARGEMAKVVLARATDITFTRPVQAAALMAASRRKNLRCYHFLLVFDDKNAFLGSSPERLWRRRESQLRTEAMAGTVASHPDDRQAQRLAEWLMQDDKNQRENLLVVEDICQRLQHYGQTLDVLPAQIIRLRKIQHLRRCIWTELNVADDERCLMQLQPTAAVAGLPRNVAREFIAQHEPFEREWYAGSAGYLSRQQSEFCVTLRSAKVTGDTVRLYAGAGIVSGSDPAQEWLEIENKAAGLLSLLLAESP